MAKVTGVTCPQCGTENEFGKSNCFQCGAALPVPERPPPLPEPTPVSAKIFMGIVAIVGGGIVSCIASAIVAGYDPTERGQYAAAAFFVTFLLIILGYIIWVGQQ